MSDTTTEKLYDAVTSGTSEPDATEARNGLRHMVSLSMTKVADGVLSPKLVLAWILNSLVAICSGRPACSDP